MEVSHFVPSCGSPLEVFLSLEHLVCYKPTLQKAALIGSSSRRKRKPKGMTFRFSVIGFSILNDPSKSLFDFGLETFHFSATKSFDNRSKTQQSHGVCGLEETKVSILF